MYALDKQHRPGQEDAEVQQDVDGHGTNPTTSTTLGLLSASSNLVTWVLSFFGPPSAKIEWSVGRARCSASVVLSPEEAVVVA